MVPRRPPRLRDFEMRDEMHIKHAEHHQTDPKWIRKEIISIAMAVALELFRSVLETENSIFSD